MNKKERLKYIVELLDNIKRIHVIDLAKELKTSDDTIRRDIEQLDKEGALTKVHGGAISKSHIPPEFRLREKLKMEEKEALAERVIPMIENEKIVLIDGGTTNLEIARQIPSYFSGRIITNSLPLATLLCANKSIDITLLGGNIFKASQITIGAELIIVVQHLFADVFIMGAGAVHSVYGITVPDREEALIKKEMMKRAKKVIVPVTSEKKEVTEPFKICSIEEVKIVEVG